MQKKEPIAVVVLAVVGFALVGCGIALAVHNVFYAQAAGQRAAEALARVEEVVSPVELADYATPSGRMASVVVDGRDYVGIVSIPSLDVRLAVQARWDERAADFTPAVYAGTAATGDLVIGGANYPAHLGRIGELSDGELVEFTDVNGRTYGYEAIAVETVGADDVAALSEGGDWGLSLFANTFSGTQRTVVRCKPVQASGLS